MTTNPAEDVQHSTLDASQDPTDAITDILMGGAEKKDDELEDEQTSKDALTEDDEEGVEELTDESTDEANTDDDEKLSWESVLGVDEGKLNFDDDGNLVGVNVKVEGQSSTVNMNDLITGFQNNKAFTQKSQAFSEDKKAFESMRLQVEQQFKSKLNDVTMLGNYLEKQLVSDFEGVNWERLRTEDAAEYAALRQDYATRAQDMQQFKDAMKAEVDKQQTDTDTRQSTANTERVRDQYNKMIVNNPAWENKEAFTKDMTNLKSFCSNQYGFKDEDFKLVQDARLIELIKDANSYRKGVKLAQEKLKKPVPKFQKSVGKGSKKISKLETLTKQAAKASGQRKRELQGEAVSELLTGGLK